MRHYNANLLFRTLPAGVLCGLLIAGCAHRSAKLESYPVEAPPTTTAPASVLEPAAPPAPLSNEAALSPSAASAAPALRDGVPLRYVVKKGDTLWDISQHFLLNAWEWPEIWYGNGQVKNPHKIYPGDVLSLVQINGRPQLVMGETGGMDSNRVQPRIRVEGLNDAIPAIPIDAIRDFLANTRVVTPEEMDRAPYLVAFMEPQLAAGSGSRAYIKGIRPGFPVGYDLVRGGQTYRDPETGKILGYEAIPIGTAELTDTTQSLAVADVVTSNREVRPGDRLLPLEQENYDPFFYPKAPRVVVHARIIGALGGVSQITQFQIVALNRGTRIGLERGDVLQIRQSGRIARDPKSDSIDNTIRLPDLDAGLVMVFKTMPEMSYGLVMNADRAIHKLDKAENPVSLH